MTPTERQDLTLDAPSTEAGKGLWERLVQSNVARIAALTGGVLVTNAAMEGQANAEPSRAECTTKHPDLCSPSACVEKAHQKFPDTKDAQIRDNWIAAHCEGEEKGECEDGVDNNKNGPIDEEDPVCHKDGDQKNKASYDPKRKERGSGKPLTPEQKAAKEERELAKDARRQAAINKKICEIDPTLPECQEPKVVEGPAPVTRQADAKVVVVNQGLTERGAQAATEKALDIRMRCAFGLGVALNLGGVFPGSTSDKRHGQIFDYSVDPALQCRYVRFGASLGGGHIFNGNNPKYTNGPRQAPNAFFMPGVFVEGDVAPIKKAQRFRLKPGLKVAGMFGGPSNNPDVAQDEGSARGVVVRPYLNAGFRAIDKKNDQGQEVFKLDIGGGVYLGGVVTNFVNGDHIAGGDPERDNRSEQNFGGVNAGGTFKLDMSF